MNENKYENLSAFVDGETELDQSELKQLATDEELKSRWSRYHLIREAMTQQTHIPVADDWMATLHDKLDAEPTVLAPTMNKPSRLQKVYKQVAGLAVAATVAAVAIVTLQNGQIIPEQSVTLAKVAPITTAKQTNAFSNVSARTGTTQRKLDREATSKLSSYIVNHYEYSMSNKLQGMIPYMRIVSETPAVEVTSERQGK